MPRSTANAAVDATFKRVKMKTYRVHAYCKCGGEYRSLGHGISNSAGSSWQHECNKCSDYKWLDQTYPAIEHKAA